MIELESYLKGRWAAGKGNKTTLVNPSTGEALAKTSTEGMDFRAALDFARAAGTDLREKTFAERGEMLRGMSRSIHSHRDELIGLAIANGGNTRSDAKFDIDGASATLAVYADLAAELGSSRILADGDAVQLGRGARLFGQHAWTTRQGAAVHVNAFNFPAWGLAEKAAVALLAGMPVVSKPATSTALVSHRIVRALVDESVCPPGVLSFVAGSAGDLLDHLSGQDVLAFTGSSVTGALLRGGKAVLAHSIRVNVEADSLNAAVLGPDVEDGSDLMNLFLGDVVRDMTQKAGQKCTAIRRVYVPRGREDVILERLVERLAAIKVGNPALDEVTMGPVATAQQLEEVRRGIARLETCAKTVFGRGELSPVGEGTARGFFLSPVLLFGRAPDANDAVHTHEVFGPVATVMPYDGTAARAATYVCAGDGGLVSSVYSDDRAFARSFVLSIAPYHGRVTLASSKMASQAIPPGTVLPQLVHGGPGRAGGGEELGGRRGLSLYMQRVALQGDRALVEAVLGGKAREEREETA
jgi:oxepin-CoA hydrolase/3-oxo-5,6-dehydrosuberyl-CoA semialdehyde dehydrogenase